MRDLNSYLILYKTKKGHGKFYKIFFYREELYYELRKNLNKYKTYKVYIVNIFQNSIKEYKINVDNFL